MYLIGKVFFQKWKQVNPCCYNMKLSARQTEGTRTRNANTMKTTTHAISTRLSGFGLLILTACLLVAPPARAGLTLIVLGSQNKP
jgi:hypothetical protein